MKVHKVTLSILDYDDHTVEEIRDLIEHQLYYDWDGMRTEVQEHEEREIPDSHPLNHEKTAKEAFQELFQKETPMEERIIDLVARAEKFSDKPHLIYNGLRLLFEEAVNQKLLPAADVAEAIAEMEAAYVGKAK